MAEENLPTDAKSRIPVTLVTGFLGSGKTTFINAALRAPELAKTVVVVNEFGEVGLDHQLFASSSDSVVVLENGCLCCTVRSDLVGTLNSLYHGRQAGERPGLRQYRDRNVGLAEPGAVLQAFLSEPTLDGLFRVASVLTLVDAVNWRGTAEAHDEAVRQVALGRSDPDQQARPRGRQEQLGFAAAPGAASHQSFGRDRGGRSVLGRRGEASEVFRLRSVRSARRSAPVA